MENLNIKKFEKRIFMSSPTMHEEEQQFIKKAFDTNWVAPLGENVNEFENEIAKYIGCKGASAMVSGTAAIHMAVKLAGVEKGDIVLCSDLTFSATVNPVLYEGGIPVFIDSERETWNMDPRALEVAFQKYDGTIHEDGKYYAKPKAVIVVNLYGVPAKLEEIQNICKKYDTILIEDAAESLSAIYKGKQTGQFGKYNAISFNGNKIITTSGGGMLVSDDLEGIEKSRYWATQARQPYPYYYHTEIGYNYRMSNIVAGIGRGQLLHLDEHKKRKTEIYNYYKEELTGLPLQMNPYDEMNSEPNFWLSCITIDEHSSVTPDELRLILEEYNIESRLIWRPMHMQPIYEKNDFICIEYKSVGEDVFDRGLCLPSDLKMTIEEQKQIVQIIKAVFKK